MDNKCQNWRKVANLDLSDSCLTSLTIFYCILPYFTTLYITHDWYIYVYVSRLFTVCNQITSVFHTNFDHMMHHLWDTTPWKVCDLDLTFKGNPRSKVIWNIIIIWLYICASYKHCHSMYRFWDNGLNR